MKGKKVHIKPHKIIQSMYKCNSRTVSVLKIHNQGKKKKKVLLAVGLRIS